MLKQGLKPAKSRIREHGRGGCLSRGLNYVRSRIRGSCCASSPRNPRRVQKTYSWTAAFVLCASFAVAKCVASVSTCVRKETGNQRPLHLEFSACAKRYHATKNSCGLAPQAHGSLSMRTETCSCKTTAAISRRPIG